MKPQLVIYYDGICFLCSNLVDFSIKHDHKKRIQYSPLQSNYAKRTLNMDETSDIDTVIVKQGDTVFKKSEAAFIILKFLFKRHNFISVLPMSPTKVYIFNIKQVF